jgi:DDE superfamily endonuclease
LPERGYIYQPNTVKGNKPINIGHSYSIVSVLPEKDASNQAAWSIPLSAERVPLFTGGTNLGSTQIKAILEDKSLPWFDQLSVLAADSTYSQRSFLFEQCKHQNLVVVARVRSNRVFYQSPTAPNDDPPRRGCPKKYGSRFSLADPNTWQTPDETTTTQHITRKGRQLTVMIQAWHNMLMRGTHHEKMYRHPFTLMRISVTDDTNIQVWKPMWLIVIGNQHQQLSSTVAYQSYRQRFDIEHMLRFGKQRLLMTEFQTPEVEHEENWIRLAMLAYVQLWAAKDLASYLPKPWERYLKHPFDKMMTPSAVQRDFQRIIRGIGKPGNSPKPRGNSTGRLTGQTQPKRSQHPVIKKGKKTHKSQEQVA